MLDKPWSWYFKAIGVCVLGLVLVWALAACSVDGPTISYGGSTDGNEFISGLEEIPDEYPHYYIARVDRISTVQAGSSFIRVIMDVPMIKNGDDIVVHVPSVCLDDISVGTYCYLIEHDQYSGFGWAGLDPDLSLYPVVNATDNEN